MAETTFERDTVVIGAGIGGLAAALRLAGAGAPVRVIEAADAPGGKLRTLPSVAGPVDAGPTVLTMLPLFEALFAEAGERLSDHVSLTREPLLARHFWPDGSTLDLFSDMDASADAVRAFAGPKGEAQFTSFCRKARRLFEAFDAPVMQANRLSLGRVGLASLANPRTLGALMPGRTLWSLLRRQFTDPRLCQLFGRYATYVGGSPFASPALLALIWQAEARGVWRVDGGMTALADALAQSASRHGARFSYGTAVERIEPCRGGYLLHLGDGTRQMAGRVVFNGDPAALATGLLGDEIRTAVPASGVARRSLSAWVWAFAAEPKGRALAHHNVFFNSHYRREFRAIAAGHLPRDATLYVCAQDRGTGLDPTGPERFEIILNGAPVETGKRRDPEEEDLCRMHTFETLSQRGLSFTPVPERPALTTPHDFAARFPGSAGSLYGLSPHGMTASFRRPTVRSKIPGLYLAGGGVHPGPGLPMALTSGRHAAEAILTDLASTSQSRRTAMRGGMSMGSRTVAPTVSRSSPS